MEIYYDLMLPETGYYCLLVIRGGRPRNLFFSSKKRLREATLLENSRGGNVYTALGVFSEKQRKQKFATLFRCLFADVDCGDDKPYKTQADAVKALALFVARSKLPMPSVVSSGHGVHIYWPFVRDISAKSWRTLAAALASAFSATGLHVDTTATEDAARVLRGVGTTNRKFAASRTVAWLHVSQPVDPLRLARILAPFAAQRREPHTGVQHRPTGVAANVISGLLGVPADPLAVMRGCEQVRQAALHQKNVPEPLWYALLGVAASCENSERVAIAWSSQYAGYDKAATLSKLRQWEAAATGPTTCARFDVLRPGICASCKYSSTISSPVQIRAEVAPPVELTSAAPTIVQPPAGFRRLDNGGGYARGGDDGYLICDFDLVPVSYGMDDNRGYEVATFSWERPKHGWRDLTIRQALLVDGNREFATVLADQGIVLDSAKTTEAFRMLLRSYLRKLQRQQYMTNIYRTMGWKEEGEQFVIGNTLLKKDGDDVTTANVSMASGTLRGWGNMYGTSGSLHKWTEATRLFSEYKLFPHAFALGLSFASPLYKFTGLNGSVLSLYGPTGTGKTLAQKWMQSVWGNPDKLHFGGKFTQNTLFHRLSIYNNLPMTIDEATMMPDKDVSDFCYWVTQGRDKARLTRNAEEKEPKIWSTSVTVSTNRSMQSMLMSSGLDMEAQMARLLEIAVPEQPLFGKSAATGRAMHEFVMSNYGLAGRAYIAHLLKAGNAEIARFIASSFASFSRRYSVSFSGSERYWEQTIVLVDAALRMAESAGVSRLPREDCIRWVLDSLSSSREAAKNTALDAYDYILQFMNTVIDSTVTVLYTDNAHPQTDLMKLPRGGISARIELNRKTQASPFTTGVVYLERTAFRKYISLRSGDYKGFLERLRSDGTLLDLRCPKYSLGKGTTLRVGQQYVVAVRLTHPKLRSVMDDASETLGASIARLKVL